MKIGGYIALFFGVINILVGLFIKPQQLGFGIGATILGFYLLNLSKKKKREQKEKDEWNNND